MTLNDIPKNSGGTLQFGLNPFKFDSFVAEDTQYGRQFTFNFSKEFGETILTQKFWYQLSKKFTEKDAWKFTSRLEQFKDVLAAVDNEYEQTYTDLREKYSSETFDNESDESVQEFQEKFLTELLQLVVGKEVNVVLHYKGDYLNIPSYKQNDFKLPFGKNPTVYGGLNSVKGVSTSNTESTVVDTTQW